MRSFPRSLSGLSCRNAAWTCSSCSKAWRLSPKNPAFNPSISNRTISNSSKSRQNAAPTMEQLRKPFQKKNSTTLYYTLSIILGTVAFSYGSVPFYKMVLYNPQSISNATANNVRPRSAKPQVGEASPSKLLAMEVLTVPTRPSACSPSHPRNVYASPSTDQFPTCCRGNSYRSSAR